MSAFVYVECDKCKSRKMVDAKLCLGQGWPECCGYTMTLDRHLNLEGLKNAVGGHLADNIIPRPKK